MVDLNRTPNPEGSPIEKLVTQNDLERIEDYVRGKLGPGPVTNEELVEVLRDYDEKLKYEAGKQNRTLELWANVHTHPGGDAGGGGQVEQQIQDVWVSIHNTSRHSDSPAMAALDNAVYVLKNTTGELWKFEGGSWTALATAPFSWGGSPAVFGAVGGVLVAKPDGSGGTGLETWVYFPGSNTWVSRTDMPGFTSSSWRYSGGSTGGRFLIYRTFSTSSHFLHVYDPDSDSWINKSTPPSVFPVTSSGVCTGGGFLYIFRSGEAWKYELATDAWTELTSPPVGFIVGPPVYLGGLIYHLTEDGWLYNPTTDSWSTSVSGRNTLPDSIDTVKAAAPYGASRIMAACGVSNHSIYG